MQTPLRLDISGYRVNYKGFVNAKNNIKQRDLNTVIANITKTASPTSDSFLILIMSHIISIAFVPQILSLRCELEDYQAQLTKRETQCAVQATEIQNLEELLCKKDGLGQTVSDDRTDML